MPCRSHNRASRAEPLWRDQVAAFALQRLDQDGCHLIRRQLLLEQHISM